MSTRLPDNSVKSVFNLSDVSTQEEKIKKVLSRVTDLAVLPHVVFQVLEASASSDTACSEIEKSIIVDPGFSAKVLTLANSASYGIPKKVTAIREAITFLGFRAVRNIAMTVGVFDLFAGKTDKESLRRRLWWRHSIDSAMIGQWLSKSLKLGSPDEAYTCGLLHYVGKTLLDRSGIGDYAQVEELIKEGLDDVKAELEVYGISHDAVTIAAGAKWNLPLPLLNGLDYRRPVDATAENAKLRACTACSSFLASVVRDEWQPDVTIWRAPAWAFSIAEFDLKDLESLVFDASAYIARASEAEAA